MQRAQPWPRACPRRRSKSRARLAHQRHACAQLAGEHARKEVGRARRMGSATRRGPRPAPGDRSGRITRLSLGAWAAPTVGPFHAAASRLRRAVAASRVAARHDPCEPNPMSTIIRFPAPRCCFGRMSSTTQWRRRTNGRTGERPRKAGRRRCLNCALPLAPPRPPPHRRALPPAPRRSQARPPPGGRSPSERLFSSCRFYTALSQNDVLRQMARRLELEKAHIEWERDRLASGGAAAGPGGGAPLGARGSPGAARGSLTGESAVSASECPSSPVRAAGWELDAPGPGYSDIRRG